MFDYERDSSSFSVVLCILLLFGSPLLCLLFGLLAAELLTEILRIVTTNRTAELAMTYLTYGFVGLVFGYVAQILVPRSYRCGGVWVWIAPSSLLAWGIVDDLMNHPSEVAGLFGFPHHHSEGLALALVTWPTVATLFFSIGVVLANRRAKSFDSRKDR